MNEIDVPRFKQGKGKLGDFVKKHKKKIEVASGLTALALPFLTYLALRDNKGPLTEDKPLTEAQVLALPKREREKQEALARERVAGTSRANLPMYPPSGGPTQKEMDDAFLESMKKSYRDRGIEKFKDNGKTYFSGYVKPQEPERKEERKESGYPSGIPPPRASREIPPPPKRHLGFFVVPPEIRSPVPQAIPLSQAHSEFLKKKGRGFVDWVKKHKRKLGLTASALAGLLGILGITGYAYNKHNTTTRAGIAEEVNRRLESNERKEQQQQQSKQDIEEHKQYFDDFMRDFGHEMSGTGEQEIKIKNNSEEGKGFLDWIYKYKKEIGIGATTIGALGALAAAIAIGDYAMTPTNPRDLIRDQERADMYRALSRPRDVQRQVDVVRNIKNRLHGGKSNPLAKKVMAYKKKHGCSLKEAWAQFK